MDAVVVGAGLGGLATALALRKRGWSVTVLERRERATEPGAGIALWPNALRALDALGVGDAVRAAGTVEAGGGIRDARGRWLVRTDTARLARRWGDGVVVLERPVLHDVLRNALPADVVRHGVPVVRVEPGSEAPHHQADHAGRSGAVVANPREGRGGPDGRAVVHDADGGRWPADLVVAADGVHSPIRGAWWPDSRVRSTGTTAFRLVADPGEPLAEGGESWGSGEYVGLAPLPGGRAYLWAVVPTRAVPTRGLADPEAGLAWLRGHLAAWHDPVPRVLAAADTVLCHPLSALVTPRSFVHGRIALVGDAAHAMTPNLGQGAAQAFEDAVALAEVGLAGYDAARRDRVASVARRSWAAGRVAALRGPLAVVRDRLVAALPAGAGDAGLDRVLGRPAAPAHRVAEGRVRS